MQPRLAQALERGIVQLPQIQAMHLRAQCSGGGDDLEIQHGVCGECDGGHVPSDGTLMERE